MDRKTYFLCSRVPERHGSAVPLPGLSYSLWVGYIGRVRPLDVQIIGNELAIKWDDRTESFVSLENLRRYCPCAGCKGEVDVMGNLHKGPEVPLKPSSFQLVRIQQVGGYALQPFWADGHESGLYTFDFLRRLPGANG